MTEHTKWPRGERDAIAYDAMLAALEAVRDLVAPESGFYIGTVGPTSREARERIDRTFQQVADALHAAKGQS